MAHLIHDRALIALFSLGLWVPQAAAEDSLATIAAPADGEKLNAGQASKVEYEVKEGSKAHHVHFFVDGAEVATGHKLKGSFPLGPLKAGDHKVCVAPVNKNHTPIGAMTCITLIAQ